MYDKKLKPTVKRSDRAGCLPELPLHGWQGVFLEAGLNLDGLHYGCVSRPQCRAGGNSKVRYITSK